MNYQTEAMWQFWSQADAGLAKIKEVLDRNPALKDAVFGGGICDLEIGLNGIEQALKEIEASQMLNTKEEVAEHGVN